MARLAPAIDSKVRAISGSRAWVMTCGITLGGNTPLVSAQRMKSKSVCDELDLLEPDLEQELEQRTLSLVPHRIGQCLVAVAQVHRAPGGGSSQRAIWPAPIGQVYTLRGSVTLWLEGHRDLGRWGPERSRRARALSPACCGREEETLLARFCGVSRLSRAAKKQPGEQ